MFSKDLSTLRNNPRAKLKTINEYVAAETRGMMIFHQHKLDVSRKIIEQMKPKPKVIVELGTYVGNSAIGWGSMLKQMHESDSAAFNDCKVFSCELDPNFIKIASDFVDLAGLSGIVEIVQGPAAESLRKLKQERRLAKADMLFIDHWEKFYLADLKVCEELGLL